MRWYVISTFVVVVALIFVCIEPCVAIETRTQATMNERTASTSASARSWIMSQRQHQHHAKHMRAQQLQAETETATHIDTNTETEHADTDSSSRVDVDVDDSMMFVESDMELEDGVGVRAWVSDVPLQNAADAREDARGAPAPAGVGNNFYVNTAAPAGHGQGRVEQVFFQVGQVVAIGGPDDGPTAICDALWNPRGYPTSPVAGSAPGPPVSEGKRFFMPGEVRSRNRIEFQNGHLIAKALTAGGNDYNDPINFFPQHAQSNAHNSKWWRIEKIAKAVRTAFNSPILAALGLMPAAPAMGVPLPMAYSACRVDAHIVLLYVHRPYVPSGGEYEIRTSTYCYNMLQLIVNVGMHGVPGPVDATIRNAYTKAFFNDAVHAVPDADPRTHAEAAIVGPSWGSIQLLPLPAAASSFQHQFPRIAGLALRVIWRNDPDRCYQNDYLATIAAAVAAATAAKTSVPNAIIAAQPAWATAAATSLALGGWPRLAIVPGSRPCPALYE